MTLAPAKGAIISFLLCVLLCAAAPATVQAERLRIASFNTELSRQGPGLLLRDIQSGTDSQVQAVIDVILAHQPDILALQGIDWDHENLALKALLHQLAAAGASYPHYFSAQPNAGLASGLDLDGDGRLGGPGDSQGFGNFTGRAGNAILSRYPIVKEEIVNLSTLLWRDLPGARLPTFPDGRAYPSAAAQAAQRLSATSHWVTPLDLPNGQRLSLLSFQATPPLFDGPEQRNALRNADELRLWQAFLDQSLADTWPAPPQRRFVLLGGANLDPAVGAGQRDAIAQILLDPRFQDPTPTSPIAGVNTVDWGAKRPMRVDYVLPSADLAVTASGVAWPETDSDAAALASRHRLVWVDILLD